MFCCISSSDKFFHISSRRPARGRQVFVTVFAAAQRIVDSGFKQLTFSAFTELTGSTHLESGSGGGGMTLGWQNWKYRLTQLYKSEVMII